MSRAFSKHDKTTLYLDADGRCEQCGKPLPPDWHADHVQPFSKGGETNVVNGQALCPECNLRKGNSEVRDRAWQQDFWIAIGQHKESDYLLVATPASGKTYAVSKWMATQIHSGRFDKVIVVVPGMTVKTHWADTSAKFNVDIDPNHKTLWGQRRDSHGVVVTYHSLAREPRVYKKLAQAGRTLLVADECHHTGTHEDSSWGDALQDVGESCQFRLLLSGTPFRTDKRSIPFVVYEDSSPVIQFEYTYDKALRDGVVRPVYFRHFSGSASWEDSGEVKSASFADDLADEDMNRRLRTALSVLDNPSLVGTMMQDAHSELMAIRENENPDAAGMVLCVDQSHARRVSEMMRQWIGVEPHIAISDDREALSKIDQFRSSKDPWLVTVKMVSEGTDIPRLQVGVYLTITLTEMFWRQAIGRFIRAECGGDAMIYIPDDPRLLQLAQFYTKRVEDYLVEEEAQQERDIEDRTKERVAAFVPLSSDGQMAGTITDGTDMESDYLKRVSEAFPDVGTDRLAAFIEQEISKRSIPVAPEPSGPPVYERVKVLKADNSKVARLIARRHEIDYAEVHRVLNKAVGIFSVNGDPRATEECMRRRLELACEWSRTGSTP